MKRYILKLSLLLLLFTLGMQYASGQSCVIGNHCNSDGDILLDCPDVPFAEYFWDARELGHITDPGKSIPGLVYKSGGNYYFSPSNIPAGFLGVEFSVVLISGTPATEGAGYWSVTARVMPAPTAYDLLGPDEVCKDDGFVLTLQNSEAVTTSYRLYQVGSPAIKGISPGKNGVIDFNLTNTIVGDYTYYVVADNGNCQTTMPDSDPANGFNVKVNDTPNVNLGSDLGNEFCAGANVTFTATGANEYAFFLGSVDVANQLQARSGNASYSTTTLTDGDVIIVEGYDTSTSAITSCTATASMTVIVNDLPTGDISGDNTICNGDATDLTFTLTGVAPWDIVYTDGVTDYNVTANTTPFNVSITPLAGATYIIKTLTDSKACGAATLTGSATIIVNDRPTSTIIGGGTICMGESATFDIAMTGVGPFTVTYSDGTTDVTLTDVASPQTVTVSPSSTATYFVKTLVDQNCTAQAGDIPGSVTVDVNPRPTSTITGGGTICNGESATFVITMTGTGPFTVVYSDGTTDVTLPNVTSPQTVTVNPAVTSTYFVKSLVDQNCTAQAGDMPGSVTVDVNERPTSTITGGGTICNGESSSFDITMTGTGPFTVTYTDGTTPVTLTNVTSPQTITVNPSATTTYSVTALADAICTAQAGDMPGSVLVDVNERPTSAITGGGTICNGGSETFNIVMTGTGPFTVTYTDGTTPVTLINVASPQAITVNPSVTTTYSVTSLVDQNCTAQASDMPGSVTVDVNDRPTSTITGGGTICDGDDTTITINMTGAGPFTVTYTDGVTPVMLVDVPSPQVITVNPSSDATYTVTALSDQACSADALAGDMPGSATVTVNNRPTGSISGGGTICLGESETFDITMTGTGPFTVTYTDGTTPVTLTNVASPQTITVTPGATSTYSLVSLSDAVCTAVPATDLSGAAVVTVNHVTANVSVSAPVVGGTEICAGTMVTFNASATDGSGNYSYNYHLIRGGVDSPNQSSIATYSTNSLQDGDVIYVVVTDLTYGCTDNSSNIVMTVNANPVVSLNITNPASGSSTVCAGTNVEFTATAGYDNYDFYLNGGLVQSSAANIYSNNSLATGDQIFVEASEGSCNGSSVPVINMIVNNLPTPTLISDQPSDIACPAEEVTFTAGGGDFYEFFVNGVSQGVATAAIEFKYTHPTNDPYDVTVTVTDANGCIATSAPLTITTNPATAGLTADKATICAGEDVTFTATGGVTYEFFVDAASVQGPGAADVYVASGLTDGQVVTVEVTNANDCVDTHAGIPITVTSLPVAGLVSDDPGADNIICAGDVITFTASGGGWYEFYLNGTSVGAGSATATYTTSALANGDRVSVLVAHSAGGCSAPSAELVHTVNPLPTATLTSDIDPATTACPGQELTFTAGGGVSYQFILDDVAQGVAAASNEFKHITAGDFKVEVLVIDGNGCQATSAPINITEDAATAGLSADKTEICADEDVTFTATGGVSYEFFVDGTNVQGPAASDTYLASGLTDGQVVTVKVINATACEDTHAGITITVNPLPIAGIVSTDADNIICDGDEVTFTASGGDMYEFFINGTSTGAASATATYITNSLVDGDRVSVNVINTTTGCSQSSAELVHTVNSLPTAGISASPGNNIITGTDVTFTATGGVEYEFFKNTLLIQARGGSDTYGAVNDLVDGDVISVNVYNANGCMASASITMSVVDGISSYDLLASATEYCADESGVSLYLSTPQVGVSYRLIRTSDDQVINPVILFDGSNTVRWDDVTVPAALTTEEFRVEAFYPAVTGSEVEMNNRISITRNNLPIEYSILPTGTVTGCGGGAGHEVKLENSETGVSYQLMLDGGNIGSPVVGNTGNEITFGFQTIFGEYTILATNATTGCSELMTNTFTILSDGTYTTYNVTGNGNYCAGDVGVNVVLDGSDAGVEYRVIRDGIENGDAWTGDGSTHTFGPYATEGSYSVVVNTSTGCKYPMNGLVNVTEVELPTSYDLQATNNGHFCPGDLVTITISGQQNGVEYELFHNDVSVVTVTGTLDDDTAPLSFGDYGVAGTYRVEARTTTVVCSAPMNNELILVEDALPTVYNVTSDGDYCTGGTTFLHLDGSDADVQYRWEREGDLVTGPWIDGNGGLLDFEITGTDTYYIVAMRKDGVTSCTSEMTPRIAINEKLYADLDKVLSIKPGTGLDCTNGAVVIVEASETGVVYELVKNGVRTGNSVTGDGTDVEFPTPVLDVDATYDVYADMNGCEQTLNNTIYINVPGAMKQYAVTGSGDICNGDPGQQFGVAYGDNGVNYTLYLADSPGSASGTVQQTIGGSDSPITFDLVNNPGEYYVMADDGAGCAIEMLNRETLIVHPLPIAYQISGSGKYCSSEAGATIKLESSEVGVEYIVQMGGLQQGTRVSGSGSQLTFGPFSAAGIYTVVAYNSTTLCTSNMNGEVTIGLDADIVNYDVVNTEFTYCDADGGIDIILASQQEGISYQVFNLAMELQAEVIGDASGDPLALGLLQEGTYTILASYGGDGCVTPMNSGNPVVIDAPLASPRSVAVQEREFNICLNQEIVINLDGSEKGRRYSILDDLGLEITFHKVADDDDSGVPVQIRFTPSTPTDAMYEVYAESDGACDLLLGVVRVITKTAPNAVSMATYTDEYCAGTGGVELTIESTQSGVGYQLVDVSDNTISFVDGTDGVDKLFANKIMAGTYHVVARDYSSGCYINSVDILITENELPVVFDLEINNGDGSIVTCLDGCIGLTNVSELELNGSQTGYIYSLLHNGLSMSPAVDVVGTAISINYGTQSSAGFYTVLATSDKGCQQLMNGNVQLYEKRLKAIDDIVPVPYGKNVADTTVWKNDEKDDHIDVNVAGVSKNIYFSLVDLSKGANVDLTVVGNRIMTMKTDIGNEVQIYDDGKITFTKLPSFYGRDSIDYVVFNTDYLDRRDTARVYFFAGNIDLSENDNLLIPNAFSPNGDGINDKFVISGSYENEVAESRLEVYNRWGSLIYRSDGTKYNQKFWDGKSNAGMVALGPDLPSGTYFYVFKIVMYVDDTDDGIENGHNVSKEYTGFIELRR